MRASLPVVVSDVGGCREAVLDGKTGFLVPAGDPKVLAEKLEKLILDSELRRSLGNAGRLRYEEEFTFEAMLKNTMAAW
jgi:glycosyltransferase involved in cell wall biosynthesis